MFAPSSHSKPGDRRDDPVAVGAGDQQARVVGEHVGVAGHRSPNRNDSGYGKKSTISPALIRRWHSCQKPGSSSSA